MYGGDRGHQQRVLAEINKRAQGGDELTRDYVVNLQALILKLVPVPSMTQQLDMLHRNMRPELQKMVMRNQITNYQGLLDLAREAELALATDKLYHSPPLPERTYLPEFVYVPSVPPPDQKKKQSPGVAAMGHQQHEPRESLEAMFRRVMAELLSTLTKKGTDENNRQKASPPPIRKPTKKGNWENGQREGGQFANQPGGGNSSTHQTRPRSPRNNGPPQRPEYPRGPGNEQRGNALNPRAARNSQGNGKGDR